MKHSKLDVMITMKSCTMFVTFCRPHYRNMISPEFKGFADTHSLIPGFLQTLFHTLCQGNGRQNNSCNMSAPLGN